MSEIDSSLLESYKTTIYHVNTTSGRIEFFIAKISPALDSLLEKHDAQTAAFITAYNPRSQITSSAENTFAHEALLKTLGASGHQWLEGTGGDPDGKWPAETSILLLAIDQPDATSLAAQLDQNAYVWIERGTPPTLILMR
jgi:hypothetical protein